MVSRKENAPYVVGMPDFIGFDTVREALRVLGLEPNLDRVEVTLSTKQVVVTVAVRGGGGQLVRTYEVGNWPVRYQPTEIEQ